MAKVGRNDVCPCGSGRKYKKCCLARNEAANAAARTTSLGPKVAQALYDAFAMADVELDDISNSAVDLIRQGRLDEAERLAQRLLDEYPQVPDGLERSAMIAEARGDLKRALDFYQRTLEFTMINDGLEEPGRQYFRDKIQFLSEQLCATDGS
jgi:tetratricopeptide (TPR) repeat protein